MHDCFVPVTEHRIDGETQTESVDLSARVEHDRFARLQILAAAKSFKAQVERVPFCDAVGNDAIGSDESKRIVNHRSNARATWALAFGVYALGNTGELIDT